MNLSTLQRLRFSTAFLPVLAVGLYLVLVDRVTAQTFTTLHNFTARSGYFNTNSDGAGPQAGLVLSGNTLYGTAFYGGSSGIGTVFAVNTDGTGFDNLHSFTAFSYYTNAGGIFSTNRDGASPYSGLILSGNTLYGTAGGGGSANHGTVFAINTDGTGFTNLHSFTATSGPYPYTNSDGVFPHAGLILSGNTLYGTAVSAGSSGHGTVFAVNSDGSGFTNLHSFTATQSNSSGYFTNSDGAGLEAGLILSDNILYGTANQGGSSGYGTVFKLNTDGTGFTNLHSFTATSGSFPNFTNSDGAQPYTGLILSANTLYGTAGRGGSSGAGAVFAINTDGTGFTNLYSFTATSGSPYYTNSDGAGPVGLILSGNTLYGAAAGGGSSGAGAVFAINTDGTDFTNLYSFTGGSDGVGPYAGLILSSNTLYGTTFGGGSSGNGTVLSLSFTPKLTIIPFGANVVLTWPTNYAGFDYTGFSLQSAPTITGTFTNIPGATSPYTNPITGAQQFFRLISN